MFVDSRFKQQHDPQKALKELVADGRLVARVMDRDRFVESLLEEITAAFEFDGASVEVIETNGVRPRSFGRVGESSAVSVPLVYGDRPLGTLTVWLPVDRESDDGHLTERLKEPADALAQVISLTPDAVSMKSTRTSDGVRARGRGQVSDLD